MTSLPDPRRYSARGAPDRLLELTRAALATGDPIARSVHNDGLIAAARACVAVGDETTIAHALAAATSAAEYGYLEQRVREAAEAPLAAGEIGARLFALPVAIVAGGRAGATIPGALPDIDAVSALLAEHSALGDVQRFSLGNALCAVERLDAVPLATLAAGQLDTLSQLASRFEPDPVQLASADESVHLRFLVGVAWVSSEAKRWIGAADPAGAWATPLTCLLAAQLAQPEVTVLPLARAPAPLALAAGAGRAAAEALRLQLFVGGVLRRLRASIGEPTVIVAAHRLDGSAPDDAATPGDAQGERQPEPQGEVRVTFSSPFDEALCEAWCRPLAAGDDLAAITVSIVELLHDCRVEDVVVVPQVQPDRHPGRPQERLLLTVAHLARGDAPPGAGGAGRPAVPVRRH